MTGPSTPTTPGSHSRGLAYKYGTITAIEGNIAYVKCQLTETISVRRDIMRAKGRLPEVGETWMLTREFDQWTFALVLTGGETSNSVPQEDVEGLVEDLDDINDTLTTHTGQIASNSSNITSNTNRLNQHDTQIAFLSRWAYGYPTIPEVAAFGNVMSSIPLFDAVHTVTVSGNGRYICLGSVPGAYLLTGVRVYVGAATAGSTILAGLFRGPIDNMTRVATASISSATTGMKTVNWSATYTTVPNEFIAVGLATTAAGVGVGGFESPIINNAPNAHVFVAGATSLLTTLVMGPTTPHGLTQGRHWVGLY
jgi:hypothetical protein